MRLAVVEFGPLPTAALRVAIAALALLPAVLLQGLGPQLRQHWRGTLMIGVINSGIPFALFAFSLLSLTTGLSAILNATVPMFGALIAWAWLGDRPSGSRLAGLALGFTGVAMLAWDKAGFRPDATPLRVTLAILACLGACICYGIAAAATKKYLAGIPPLVTATGSQLGATLGLALPAAWLWPVQVPGARAWLALLAVGVLCTAIAYVLFFRLIAQAGPQRTLTVTFVVPLFAVFYGVLFLGEPVTPWMLACGVVIVTGTALSSGIVHLGRRPAVEGR
jgi:drug/metabolite transporter (DMT)-like permease